MICEVCGRIISNEEIGLCEACAPLGIKNPSSHGMLSAFFEHNKYGLKNEKTGAVIVNPIFSSLEYSADSDMIFRAELEGKQYLIPAYYELYMPQVYSSYSDHSPGYLSKTGHILESRIRGVCGFGIFKKNEHYGVMDAHYDLIIPPIFDSAMNYPDEDGFGKYMIDLAYYSNNRNKKNIHFIKSRDYFTREILVDYLDQFLNDMTDEFWYYDEKLKTIFCPFLNWKSHISEGPCRYFKNGKYGLAHSSGRLLTKPIYDEIESSAQADIYRYRIGERYGFIDSQGNDAKVLPKEVDKHSKIQRVCRCCGEVWFSHIGDEVDLEPSFISSFAIGMARSLMSEQGRIESIVDERLKRDATLKLRQCPKCGKKNYDELILF